MQKATTSTENNCNARTIFRVTSLMTTRTWADYAWIHEHLFLHAKEHQITLRAILNLAKIVNQCASFFESHCIMCFARIALIVLAEGILRTFPVWQVDFAQCFWAVLCSGILVVILKCTKLMSGGFEKLRFYLDDFAWERLFWPRAKKSLPELIIR